MSDSSEPVRVELVPRLEDQGYAPEQVAERRRWAEAKTGARLDLVGHFATPPQAMRGNIENPIGAVEVPLGLAGPLAVRGDHAQGTFYVPLATTEGAVVRTYERGMVAITRAGGARVTIERDENRVTPVFEFADLDRALGFRDFVLGHEAELRSVAEATTRHGKLLRATPRISGPTVLVDFDFSTGDASGMNLVVRAADRACRFLVERCGGSFLIFSGAESEKHASGRLFEGGKGKRVHTEALLPARTLRAVLRSTAADLVRVGRLTLAGHLEAASLGYNGQLANGLAAIFIACGQDVGNLANSAVGITRFEEAEDGALRAHLTLPSLTVGTVGGGTQLGTAKECLDLMDCSGTGKAKKFAEIVAATLLAGELSMAAAIASGELSAAHEALGRNPPAEATEPAGPAE
jgi:hydroxymethylglutaryl-CoA reductase (NADPH)